MSLKLASLNCGTCWKSLFVLAGLCLLSSGCGKSPSVQVKPAYVCVEDQGVFLVNIDSVRCQAGETVWSWRAADSPEIPPEHKGLFRGYDECKPALGGSCVLVSSSWNGAAAVIRRSDKKCLFYTQAKNAHSLELIDGRFLAVAVSGEKGQVALYDLGKDFPARAELDARPAWSTELPWAHGVVWDGQSRVLYALGESELLKLRLVDVAGKSISAEVVTRWKLPGDGGHDLSRFDEAHLAISMYKGCCLFDTRDGTFKPLPGLENAADVKSISRDPGSGRVIYTQATTGNFASGLSCLPTGSVKLPYPAIYKVRWNIDEASR